jgi:hypothetical protein
VPPLPYNICGSKYRGSFQETLCLQSALCFSQFASGVNWPEGDAGQYSVLRMSEGNYDAFYTPSCLDEQIWKELYVVLLFMIFATTLSVPQISRHRIFERLMNYGLEYMCGSEGPRHNWRHYRWIRLGELKETTWHVEQDSQCPRTLCVTFISTCVCCCFSSCNSCNTCFNVPNIAFFPQSVGRKFAFQTLRRKNS